MRQTHVDDRVRLTCDIPELSLNRGDVGLVRSIWFAPNEAFEVEFGQPESGGQIRALVMPPQIVSMGATESCQNETGLPMQ